MPFLAYVLDMAAEEASLAKTDARYGANGGRCGRRPRSRPLAPAKIKRQLAGRLYFMMLFRQVVLLHKRNELVAMTLDATGQIELDQDHGYN